MKRVLGSFVLLLGCVEGPSAAAGQETGPCVDGSCFDGLMCLSDFCVGPDAEPGETSGEGSQAGDPSGDSDSSDDDDDGDATNGDPTNGDPTNGDPTNGDPTNGDPTNGDPTGGGTWGACDQLDILFVVDNSGSMVDEQGRLIDAGPGFLDDVVERSGSEDHHVMVVDTDAWVFGGCETTCALLQSCSGWDEYVCGETEPLLCEDVLGAGVTHPRGYDASNMGCGFGPGRRYLELSNPDAEAIFTCAAAVGTGSSEPTEVPMEAMVTAVNTTSGDAADCNEGFLRDGAPLVVVFVTDEDDGEGDSSGSPEGWVAGLAAAKGGDQSRIAVLGIFGDNDDPDGICEPYVDQGGAEASPRLEAFVEEFGQRGARGSVCRENYRPALNSLLDILDTMCE